MPTIKLTGVQIRNLKPPVDKQRENYFDSQHHGLCLRVGRRDKTWAYHYRFNGQSRSPSLGKYAPGRADHMDRLEAIAAANLIQSKADQGVDPKSNARHKRSKPSVKNENLFRARVNQFLKIYEKDVKTSTYDQARRLLTGNHVSEISGIEVGQITRAMLTGLLEEMSGTAAQSNRLHAYLGRFFNWCWDNEYVNPSPMAGLKKRFSEKPRTRYLHTSEIKSLWGGAGELGYPLGDWVKFTLATGQRPGECRNLCTEDIDNNVWLVEGGDPKNKERHRIPLPKIAQEIVRKVPAGTSPYVFSFSHGDLPMSQSGKLYGEIYKTVKIAEDWEPRDLRRTFQTHASEELDFDPHIIGIICNQKSVAKPGVARIYNKASWMKQKKAALNKWNDWLLKVVKDG